MYNDITGKRFGKLIAVKELSKYPDSKWLFKCDCGSEKITTKGCAVSGRTKSCGCLFVESGIKKRIDLSGKRFGRLTVLNLDHREDVTYTLYFKCKCDCGKEIIVAGPSLKSGNTKSCGCFFKEALFFEERTKKISKTWFRKGQRPHNADLRKGKSIEDIYGKEKSVELKEKMSNRIRTVEENIKRSLSCKKSRCGFGNKGRRCTPENRKKARIRSIAMLKATNVRFHPGYNKRGCEFFDKLSKYTGNAIRHALNGGEYHIQELGYWVDGYDKENNIVYEFDEKYLHYDVYGNLREKDILKQKEIIEFLKCRFIRIKWDEVDEDLFELSSTKGIPIKIPVVWNSYNTDALCYRKVG